MSTTSDLWDDGRLPGLSGPKQAGRALKLIKAHWAPVLVIWLLITAASAGAYWMMNTYDTVTAPAFSPAYLATTFVGALLGGLLSGAIIRILLDKPLGVDAGFLTFVLIMTLATFVPSVAAKLLMGTPADAADPAAAMGAAWRSLVMMIGYLVWIYVALKLILWPIGVLVGDAQVTPGKSWKLMQRAFWGYILGAILLAGVPFVILMVFGIQAATSGRVGETPMIAAPFAGLMAVATAALAAALYRLRREDDTIAEHFT
ncbi:hypothetical protein [Phenylobacterium sp.]|jgi:hypothetical protein|uniref:hypothetical protein n=1 Tax=Phenylobacterium sp. TaxID=1871053 RepID=UPI002F950227